MKTQGEIEAAVSDGIRRFEQEFMGRGSAGIHCYLIGSLLVIRLVGVLTAAEQQPRPVAGERKGQGPTQAGEDPTDRSGPAGLGSDGP